MTFYRFPFLDKDSEKKEMKNALLEKKKKV